MTKYVNAGKLIKDLETRKNVLRLTEIFSVNQTDDKVFNKALDKAIEVVNLHAEKEVNLDSEIQELKERIVLLEAIYEIDQATIKKLFKTNKLLKQNINQH
ncbi:MULTISPECIES: hypothetical protein [unclassified Enterococcus]|uniref:hypothetical protein n=1 Tax=unclassified Enterococcus TaxID=2608891 RepID=UPI0015577A98|nr:MULTISPECIES: hypothetical protein [unclassified Enterococcus]MBS7578385.1 hypothetical protein [Enterococcus sp. MMGLQ5-2]MBS7585616.1 hypothetical protein [Enterococcus sp. MMGLQ5-1]NPD13475.1 hypothetical protein [Enterococcus sp. MMGLQ5-1]NPD38217.1 hypothetical protein [Enterococcus sp. MMGLQ5-2]